jgi:ubiquitin C-terminal hydrolase
MNATLQCFSKTKALTEYFLNQSHENLIKNGLCNNNHNGLRLASPYYTVVSNLWKIDGKKAFNPKNFKDVLGILNPLFEKMEESDAKDMIIFFLEQIHKEINLVNPPKTSKFNPNLNQYDKMNMLQQFLEEFKNTNKSIISDYFFSIMETTQECQNCKITNVPNYIVYNYCIQNIIFFPLEEVRKFKNNNFNNQLILNQMQMMQNYGMNPMMMNMGMNGMNMLPNMNTNEVNLDDCFEYNQKDDFMTGENKIFCNKCKQYSDSINRNKIFSFSNILIMILNRGKNNIYKVTLNFPEKIDLTKYVLDAQDKYIYNLYGVITHLGESGESGHFVASCKSPVDNKWYRYNDSIVYLINDFNKEVEKFGTPYILFYQRDSK